MKKPFVKGGKALTLAAACCAVRRSWEVLRLWQLRRRVRQAPRQKPRYSRREWQARLPPVRFQEINRTLRLDFPAAGM